MDLLIEQHDAGVEHRGGKSKENAAPFAHARKAGLDEVRHQRNAQQRRNDAEQLAKRQPLVYHKGGGDQDKHRGHVVAQLRNGDGGVAVCLKEQDPVEADH